MLYSHFKTVIIAFLFLGISSNSLFAGSWFADSLFVEPETKRPELPQIKDIRDTARLSKTQNLPILIMFGTDECPYCEMLREEFLIPMIISGDYTDKVILREVHISDTASMIDFAGKKIRTRDFSRRYGVSLFPTTVLIDSKGNPLVKKIIGITTPSLFGGTLDSRIDEALKITRKSTSQLNSPSK